jgi:hypothetical protein
MKIIGRTDLGARIVEIPLEEMTAMYEVKRLLNSIDLDSLIVKPDGVVALSGTALNKEERGDRALRLHSGQAEIKTRICLWCKKPLPKEAHPYTRTHKGDCKRLHTNKSTKERWQKAHPGSVKQIKTKLVSELNRADPRITPEQRLELIKASCKRTEVDN